MLPLNNTARLRSFPAANVLLILANLVVFLYELQLGPGELEQFINTYGIIPARVLSGAPQGLMGLFTGVFIHGGWVHAISNLWALFLFGSNVEDRMGPVRYLAFYLLGGVISSLAQVVVASDLRTPVIGASGAVAGVLGAYLLLFPRSHVHSLVLLLFLPLVLDMPAVIYLGVWFALQFASGLLALGEVGVQSNIAYWAHIGGFLYGLVLVPFFTERARRVHQRHVSL